MRHLPTHASSTAPALFGGGRDFLGDMMRSFFWPSGSQAGGWTPAADIVETPVSYRLRLDVPGFKPEEIEINLTGDTLSVRGERKAEVVNEDEREHFVERTHGRFERTFRFPVPVGESDGGVGVHW